MNQYVTGFIIKKLREAKQLTQANLAERIGVSDKAVSKWETGKGYPDICLLESIAAVLGVSVAELLSGVTVENRNISANMLRSDFYVCPICGNVIHSMGEAAISCHGIMLTPLEVEEMDYGHMAYVERVEDEYYVRMDHEMSKKHYISFVAAISSDGMQMTKLYPEGNPEVRFTIRGVRKILFYCNQEGLYSLKINSQS